MEDGVAVDPGPLPPSEWWLDQKLAQTLYAIVQGCDLVGDTLHRELSALEAEHGDQVYGELIFLLSRVKLPPEAAREHWQGVIAHCSELSAGVGRPVDVRVGLVSYYLDVNRRLERPKVVEMAWMERAMASVYVDDLTKLPNHRFFREQLAREIDRSRRGLSPLSLLLVDVDDFKRVNERLGHEGGNAILAALAGTLRARVRVGDIVARYGGEEFVILLPATGKTEARRLAEELRLAVTERPPVEAPGPAVGPTVSIGLATCPADARDASALVVAADRALYEAKAAGKDRVCLYNGSSRSFRRRRAAWCGHLRTLSPVPRAIETAEIGESGFLFLSHEALPVGSLIEADLVAPDGQHVRAAGRVAWSRRVGPERVEIAVRVLEPGAEASAPLARWVAAS
jgi:diguanylate cyclase (GGDEF)-like protein